MRNLLSMLCGANSAPAWTPADLPGVDFVFDPEDASTLTLNVADIQAATDANGINATPITAPSAGARPARVAAQINGRSIARFVAGTDELKGNVGAASGTAPFWDAVVVKYTTLAAGINVLLSHGATGSPLWFGTNQNAEYNFPIPGVANFLLASPDPQTTAYVLIIFAFDGTNSQVWINGQLLKDAADSRNIGDALWGICTAGIGGVYGCNADVAWAATGHGAALTRADVNSLGTWLKSPANVGLDVKTVIAIDGTSIGAGSGLASPSTEAWPSVAAGLIDSGFVNLFNGCAPSETVADMNVDAATTIDPLFSKLGRYRAIAVMESCTNTLFYGADEATALADAIADTNTWLAARQAAGWCASICMPLPRTGFSPPVWFESARQDYIAAYSPGGAEYSNLSFDAFDPVADVPALANTLDATRYQDGVHPTALGASEYGAAFAAYVNGILA